MLPCFDHLPCLVSLKLTFRSLECLWELYIHRVLCPSCLQSAELYSLWVCLWLEFRFPKWPCIWGMLQKTCRHSLSSKRGSFCSLGSSRYTCREGGGNHCPAVFSLDQDSPGLGRWLRRKEFLLPKHESLKSNSQHLQKNQAWSRSSFNSLSEWADMGGSLELAGPYHSSKFSDRCLKGIGSWV